MKLYSYWRSSAAYRVRIALALKEAAFDQSSVSIHPDTLAQRSPEYAAINPQMRVPTLEVDGRYLGQSMAILEWIEETIDGPSLLPVDPWQRAECRAFAQMIASDIHPIQNSSVLAYLKGDLCVPTGQVSTWVKTWMGRGFAALETLAQRRDATPFLFGDAPTFADICLVPQIYNANRFEVDLRDYPRLVAADEAARAHPAFIAAAPENQPDAN